MSSQCTDINTLLKTLSDCADYFPVSPTQSRDQSRDQSCNQSYDKPDVAVFQPNKQILPKNDLYQLLHKWQVHAQKLDQERRHWYRQTTILRAELKKAQSVLNEYGL